MFLPPWANGPTPAQTFAAKYPIKPGWGPEAPDMSAGQAILFKALEGFHTPCLPGSPLMDSGAHWKGLHECTQSEQTLGHRVLLGPESTKFQESQLSSTVTLFGGRYLG